MLRTTKLDISASNLLREVMLETELDFWREPAPGKSADILVSGDQMESVKSWLESQGIGFSTMVENVQRLIEETRPSRQRRMARTGANYTMDWEDYHTHEVLNEFIEALADANDFARIINIGQSHEGRDMKVLALEKVRHQKLQRRH